MTRLTIECLTIDCEGLFILSLSWKTVSLAAICVCASTFSLVVLYSRCFVFEFSIRVDCCACVSVFSLNVHTELRSALGAAHGLSTFQEIVDQVTQVPTKSRCAFFPVYSFSFLSDFIDLHKQHDKTKERRIALTQQSHLDTSRIASRRLDMLCRHPVPVTLLVT